MEHTPECLAATARAQQEIETYKKQWPNHCQKCHGWGGFYSTYDPSPAGVSLGSGCMEDFDPCDACETGDDAFPYKCSRCGEHLPEHPVRGDPPPCPKCGWDWGHNKGDALPEQTECICPMDWDND